MNIGIIECGLIPEALRARYDSYPGMFAAQLRPLLPGARFETVSVVNGAAPPAPDAMDAWLLTGSRHGVYDGLPWMEPLKDFIRAAAAARRPMVGVCFGHQILAEALGGRVRKADIGWRVGMEQYTTSLGNGDDDTRERIVAMPAFHQDQVVVQPPRSRVMARAPACPYAALRYDDAPILSVQFHPEFRRPYLADLIDVLSKQEAQPGLPAANPDGRATPDDTGMRWIAGFLSESFART